MRLQVNPVIVRCVPTRAAIDRKIIMIMIATPRYIRHASLSVREPYVFLGSLCSPVSANVILLSRVGCLGESSLNPFGPKRSKLGRFREPEGRKPVVAHADGTPYTRRRKL